MLEEGNRRATRSTKASAGSTSFVPPSDAMRAAGLVEREELLIEEARFVCDSSYRRRQEIELELSDVRRELKLLGFPPHTPAR